MKKAFLSSLLCLSTFLIFGQIQLLNDEFNNSQSTINWKNINTTEGWGIQQLERMDINTTTEGNLNMMPYTATWFGEYRGPLIYKEVTGDFVFTTNVAVQGRAGDLPAFQFNLSGLMCRTPVNYPNGALAEDGSGWQPGSQNYIFLAIGAANSGIAGCEPSFPLCPQLEVKTTTNSNSRLEIQNIDAAETQLRFARIGQAIIILYKLATSNDWLVHSRYQRDDFPETIQMGFVTYTDWPTASSAGATFHNTNTLNNEFFPDRTFNPDIIGDYDFARFDSLAVPMALESRNFASPSSITNAELLSFLSYESTPFCPTSLHISDNITSNAFVEVAAMDVISMDNSIATNSTVHISAGNSVTLLPGFEALAGTDFLANIGTCANNNTSLNKMMLQKSLPSLTDKHPEITFQLTAQPNPFSVETSIRFVLEKAQLVNLRIYDMKGRKVASILENDWLEQGDYQYTYLPTNGTDSFLYLVLESNQKVVVRKLILLE